MGRVGTAAEHRPGFLFAVYVHVDSDGGAHRTLPKGNRTRGESGSLRGAAGEHALRESLRPHAGDDARIFRQVRQIAGSTARPGCSAQASAAAVALESGSTRGPRDEKLRG